MTTTLRYYTEAPRTLAQAADQRAMADAIMEAKAAAQAKVTAGKQLLRDLAAQYPHIGILSRRGRDVFYVTAPVYREAANPLELLQD